MNGYMCSTLSRCMSLPPQGGGADKLFLHGHAMAYHTSSYELLFQVKSNGRVSSS